MGQVLFQVTDADIALLDDETFEAVWSALGLVARARAGRHAPVAVPRRANHSISCECGTVLPDRAGLAAHRQAEHPSGGRTDFRGRAAAAADRTWRENHDEATA